VTTSRPLALTLLTAALLAGCSGGTEPNPAIVDCSQVTPTSLGVGDHAVIDASQVACTRIPAAGSGGAEYLYVALSATGKEDTVELSTPYQLTGSSPGVAAAVATLRTPLLRAFQPPTGPQVFHQRLRELERELSQQPGAGLLEGSSASVAAQVPDTIGEQRTFNVLKGPTTTGKLSDFVQVTATAKYIGTHAAIFLDNNAPSPGGYTQTDLDSIGVLFDTQLYPTDVNAFGSESDINGDNLVLILLTDQVDKLASCSAGEIIVGFFFALDLTPSRVGSNAAEIFYGLTPDPTCQITRDEATRLLPRVMIHEFQHMINYNQHALLRRGRAEDTWLNEGLSSFAEELGGRTVPDANCRDHDCRTQFTLDDFDNGYAYLSDVEDNFLIGSRIPPIPLAEYGAVWLFVRWLADHFAATQPLGTELTRKLVQTSQVGSANVAAATGEPFPSLVGEWQLANYLDNLPGFTPSSDRLQYTSWDFRSQYAFLNSRDQASFPLPYPLVPDSALSGAYSRSGTLRNGSGRHVLILQQPSDAEVDFLLTGSGGTTGVPRSFQPRAALARIR
jgi:hypothetical protein